MSRIDIVVGIDIGTYQVKVLVVKRGKDKKGSSLPQIIGTGYSESRGMRNGYIINESDITRSVRSAVMLAEKSARIEIKRAY